MDRVHTFNENFDQWRESNSSEENISFVKDLYRDMPEMFSEDHMAPLSEELTYTCYRTGTLISIAADYYSYLGGAHPNTVILDVDGDDGRHIQVQASSVGGGEIVVNAIDGLEAGFSGHENTLVITHHDTPGMIASISGELAAANLNIATMRVFRRSVGGDAMVALELDGSADTELIARLSALQGVYHVAYLAAKEE